MPKKYKLKKSFAVPAFTTRGKSITTAFLFEEGIIFEYEHATECYIDLKYEEIRIYKEEVEKDNVWFEEIK